MSVPFTSETVEVNESLDFDVNNKTLGNEVIKIYMDTDNKGGLTFKIISKPKLEMLLPPEYITYVCRSIGMFMIDSLKHLSSDNDPPPAYHSSK